MDTAAGRRVDGDMRACKDGWGWGDWGDSENQMPKTVEGGGESGPGSTE